MLQLPFSDPEHCAATSSEPDNLLAPGARSLPDISFAVSAFVSWILTRMMLLAHPSPIPVCCCNEGLLQYLRLSIQVQQTRSGQIMLECFKSQSRRVFQNPGYCTYQPFASLEACLDRKFRMQYICLSSTCSILPGPSQQVRGPNILKKNEQPNTTQYETSNPNTTINMCTEDYQDAECFATKRKDTRNRARVEDHWNCQYSPHCKEEFKWTYNRVQCFQVFVGNKEPCTGSALQQLDKTYM